MYSIFVNWLCEILGSCSLSICFSSFVNSSLYILTSHIFFKFMNPQNPLFLHFFTSRCLFLYIYYKYHISLPSSNLTIKNCSTLWLILTFPFFLELTLVHHDYNLTYLWKTLPLFLLTVIHEVEHSSVYQSNFHLWLSRVVHPLAFKLPLYKYFQATVLSILSHPMIVKIVM